VGLTMEFTGEALNGYRILEPVGYDGFSILYKASASNGENLVTIKVFPAELSRDRQILERMRASFQDLNRINHPGIPPVMKFSISEGFPYIVFPYMSAGSLEDRIAIGALGAINAEVVIREAASILEKAHSKGLVHGDLNPSQILFDENGKVQIIGIGEASIFSGLFDGREAGEDGWFDYRAPEVKNGRPITPSSDQYSLALIALQLLARLPVDQALQGMEFHQHNGNGYRTRPNNLVIALPTKTIDVLARALSSNPSERYPSIKAMFQALEGSIWKETTPTNVSPVKEKPAPKKQNHSRLLVFAVAIIIVLCFFAIEPVLSMQGNLKFENLLSTIGLNKPVEIADNGSTGGETTEAIDIIVLPADKNTDATDDAGIQLTEDPPTQGTDEIGDDTPDPESTPVPLYATSTLMPTNVPTSVNFTSTPINTAKPPSTATLMATPTAPLPTLTSTPVPATPTSTQWCSSRRWSDHYCTPTPTPTRTPTKTYTPVPATPTSTQYCSPYRRSPNYCTPTPTP
jgi:serine/threonine protein kinase